MRKFVLILCFLFSLFNAKGQVVINEYSAANRDAAWGFADNYGEYEDWVELYNPTASVIDLTGWALSDKAGNPTKWIFPSSFNIPSGGVAVIYCSGRNEINGVNQNIVNNCDEVLEINQYGTKHSLNVSIAAGIVIWSFFKLLNN